MNVYGCSIYKSIQKSFKHQLFTDRTFWRQAFFFGMNEEFETVTNEDHRRKVSNTEITAAAQAGRLSMQECVTRSTDSSS